MGRLLRFVHLLGRLGCYAAFAAVVSCGGEDSPADAPKICDPGETRVCVGPGACSGGQSCDPDGKSWGTCTCGGGTGGTAGAGGSGTGGSGGTSAAAGTAGQGGSVSCSQTLEGPKLVSVGSFCMDSTEVTQSQYKKFLDEATAKPPAQVSRCAGNTSFMPLVQGYDPVKLADYPVPVDWCDASAYCAWAGKRLCGAISGGGLKATGDQLRPEDSQFLHVCTQAGTTKYPYGDAYSPNACNTAQTLKEPVASRAMCRGATSPFDQIFDLLGNTDEWIDACLPEPSNECFLHHTPEFGSDCYSVTLRPPGATNKWGFRCCSK